MAEYFTPGAPYTSRFSAGLANTGLVGTVRFRLLDSDPAVDDPVYGPSTDDIIEDPTGSGDYLFHGAALPTTVGKYYPAWDLGAGQLYYDEDIVVAYTAPGGATPTGRDLCTLADVLSYVPAYTSDAMTDATLQRMITAESELIMSDGETGREIVGPTAPEARTFNIRTSEALLRHLEIGDLASTDGLLVELLNPDLTVAQTVAADAAIPYYDGKRYRTSPWEPITALAFPWGLTDTPTIIAPTTFYGQVVRVTGSWGFPEIPAQIREACAARVIVRYLSEVASAGTDLAQAVTESGLNIQALYQTAQDALDSISGGVVMA